MHANCLTLLVLLASLSVPFLADVVMYAQGPWSHLFVGVMEQTMIYDIMWYE